MQHIVSGYTMPRLTSENTNVMLMKINFQDIKIPVSAWTSLQNLISNNKSI